MKGDGSMNNDELKVHAKNIRCNIIKMLEKAGSGHPGGSLSITDILTYLYFEVMDINKTNIDSYERDRFVLSKGHAAPGLYSTLCEKGLISEEELMTYRQLGSRLQGHPKMHTGDGVDMSTGSLGQGISAAVGMALANKIDGNSHRVFVMIGDGESEEGQVWEASMAANRYHLDNLTVILDFNHLQIDGTVEEVIDPTPFVEKFKAFKYNTIECDGHDFDSIHEAFTSAFNYHDGPTAIVAHTIKGKGVSFMENQIAWHGKAPNAQQRDEALKELEESK